MVHLLLNGAFSRLLPLPHPYFRAEFAPIRDFPDAVQGDTRAWWPQRIGGVMNNHTIVVGVDGSDHSKAALRWAVKEAALRGARVRAVHAWQVYPALHPGTTITARDFDEVRAQAGTFVEDFVKEVVPEQNGVEIEAAAVQGESVAPALIDEAAGAELLVVGSRGLGGFRGLLLGSVSQQCVHHARCPVVVLPRSVTQ